MTVPRQPRIDISWDFASLPKFGQAKPRYAIGIARTEGESVIRASLVRTFGSATNLVCDVVGAAAANLDTNIAALLLSNAALENMSARQLMRHKIELAEKSAELVRRLRNTAQVDHADVLVIGVDGLGIWGLEQSSPSMYEPLCDASYLAEATGITVIDDFPSRDLAHGGRGGPTTAVADWILLGDRSGIPGQRNRGILRIGPTARLTLFPSRSVCSIPPAMFAIDVCVGMELIEGIARRYGIAPEFLREAAFAVGGVPRKSLLDAWQAIEDRSSKWSPHGEASSRYVDSLDSAANSQACGADDLFATAIRFLSTRISIALQNDIPPSMPVCEIILSGPLQSNGLLLCELNSQLGNTRVTRIDSYLQSGLLDSAAAGVMAILCLDQVVGNSASLTGTKTPRILGRVNCGNPANWSAVANGISEFARQLIPLRFSST